MGATPEGMNPNSQTPFLVDLDFEATCEDRSRHSDWRIEHQEIIRGLGDVLSIRSLVIRLLECGAKLAPTWSDEHRQNEGRHRDMKWRRVHQLLQTRRELLKHLPNPVEAAFRRSLNAGFAIHAEELTLAEGAR